MNLWRPWTDQMLSWSSFDPDQTMTIVIHGKRNEKERRESEGLQDTVSGTTASVNRWLPRWVAEQFWAAPSRPAWNSSQLQSANPDAYQTAINRSIDRIIDRTAGTVHWSVDSRLIARVYGSPRRLVDRMSSKFSTNIPNRRRISAADP